jgi:hypothetical protein
MKRRTLLQTIASLVAVQPFARFRLSAQTAAPGQLTPEQIRTLRAMAEVVLPASIGTPGRDKAVSEFVTWVRNYKAGADMGHSYGASRLSAASGPSPAARYPAQFAALDKSAEALGIASFAGLPIERRRQLIDSALSTPQPVTRLPARPTGANLVADFMGFFFNGPDGYNLAYNAAIDRDTCRGLDGSDQAPEPLR